MKIRRSETLLFATVLLGLGGCGSLLAAVADYNVPVGDMPMGRFRTVDEMLLDKGIELGIGVTGIYQQNVHGGISTHRRSGRFAGSYDIELGADLEKLLGWKDAQLYMLNEGSFSDGINDPSVGSYFGVNTDAVGDQAINVSELWGEFALWGDSLHMRIGKIDLANPFEYGGCPIAFDASMFANDEVTQFLNGALVNNPTIPLPEFGLAMEVHYTPDDFWYMSAAIADAQASATETGFNTTFHGPDYFFYIFETGITPRLDSTYGPLQGAYRFGFWYDPQEKEDLSTGGIERDDTGFYMNFDQMLCKENTDSEDSQGLGAFGRYGWASSTVNEVTNFWSVGLQYQGLIEGRDEDVAAIGFAQGFFSNQADDFSDDYESVVELYYNIQVSPLMAVTPSLQYITNPGGTGAASDAVVLGARVQLDF